MWEREQKVEKAYGIALFDYFQVHTSMMDEFILIFCTT